MADFDGSLSQIDASSSDSIPVIKHRWLTDRRPALLVEAVVSTILAFVGGRHERNTAAVHAAHFWRWVISGHYDKRDPRKSVEQFRVLREGNLALLESLEPEQWKHYGIHSERGPESIEHIVRMFAGHDINHLQQIEKILVRK